MGSLKKGKANPVEAQRVHWTDAMTKLLLSQIEEQKQHFSSSLHKDIWEHVAVIINAHDDYNVVNADNCLNKWNSLKKKYKEIKDKRNRTGGGSENWAYYEIMDEILHKDPEINPRSVNSSTHGIRTNQLVADTSNSSDEENHDNAAVPKKSSKMSYKNRPIKKRSNFKCACVNDLQVQKERHHKEIMEQKKLSYRQREEYLDLVRKPQTPKSAGDK